MKKENAPTKNSNNRKIMGMTRVCHSLGGEWVPCERGFKCVVEKRVNVPSRERAFPSATALFSRHCPSCCCVRLAGPSSPFLFRFLPAADVRAREGVAFHIAAVAEKGEGERRKERKERLRGTSNNNNKQQHGGAVDRGADSRVQRGFQSL